MAGTNEVPLTPELARNTTVDFEAELNPAQWEAVRTIEGPVLILAGAGSGKTRALTYRLAYLVATGAALPHEILAVTFTNKAAREMLERTQGLLTRVGQRLPHDPYNRSGSGLWISTFHSSCVRILRDHLQLLGFEPGFTIYDDSDQLSVIKKVCRDLNINDKIFPPKNFQRRINEAKNQYQKPEDLLKMRGHFLDEKAGAVYAAYDAEMRRSNSLDFGDLLFKTVELFEKYPEVLAQYQERFRYQMIDEYQDTNHIQYRLIKLLASKYQNLCVVGDEDQSIYSWRGADISNILSFEKDFPAARVIKLEENYRSTGNIVEAASHVIKNNSERKDKTLWTGNAAGAPIVIKEEMTEHDEARTVVKQIEALRRDENRSLKEFAIFYRTNAQSRVIEDQLRSHGLNYKIIGGLKFYDRAEVKDLLAYLRVLANPKDDVSLKRIINTPARGIGKTTIDRLAEYASTHQHSLFDGVLHALKDKLLDNGATKKVLAFFELISDLREKAQTTTVVDLFHHVLDGTQYVQKLRLEDTVEAQARIDNLKELENALNEFEKERGDEATLTAFLEEVALVTDADRNNPDDEAVTLMTLHMSKGLEFPNVFVVGLEETLFPSAGGNEFTSDEDVEEERRLFYVGMTRARERLWLTYARMRRVWGQERNNPPSRFLSEIPDKYVERVSAISRPTGFGHGGASYADRAAGGSGGGWRQKLGDPKSAHDWQQEAEPMPDYESFADDDAGDLRRGMRVRHPSFGAGTIWIMEGAGSDQKVTIRFDDNSLKKFVVRFAKLERI